jgi:hypothetical protein
MMGDGNTDRQEGWIPEGWIPAFAGMTTSKSNVLGFPRSRE